MKKVMETKFRSLMSMSSHLIISFIGLGGTITACSNVYNQIQTKETPVVDLLLSIVLTALLISIFISFDRFFAILLKLVRILFKKESLEKQWFFDSLLMMIPVVNLVFYYKD